MMNERMRAIAATVAAMSEEQRAAIAAAMPVLTIEGHAISARNVCMITAQTEAPVTIIGGFRQWLARGRCVRKGEKALYILKPCERTGAADEATPAPGEAQEEAGGRSLRFVPVPVFDVSQTDALPEERLPRGLQLDEVTA